MNFETIKSEEFAERVKLVGVTLKPKVVNKNITGVEFSDAAGNVVVFEKSGYSGFEILVPSKPKKKVWKVTGTLETLGLWERTFEKEQDAIAAKEALSKAGADDADWNSCEIEVSDAN